MKKIDGLPLPDAILLTAIQTFPELGFEKTSMDEIAVRAMTTKRTVYAHFGSKEELFRAALARAVQMFLAELPRLRDAGDPASELERFAIRFSELCTWRGAVRLQRVAISEAERFPDIGAMLHREVIEASERMLSEYLQAVAETLADGAREAIGSQAASLAGVFLNMTTSRLRFATLLGAREPPLEHPDILAPVDKGERAEIVRAVRIFLIGSGIDVPSRTV
jgi:AcrR family transcriptional regulator